MTDFNKLLAADELLKAQEPLTFRDIPIEVCDDVPPHNLYLIGKDIAMVKGINENQNWGFIEFTRHSAEYMLGSINPLMFYLGLPYAWWKFDRQQRRDRGKV